MLRQFAVPPEVQQFLSGLDSAALLNVVWDINFPGEAPLLPTNPSSIRRSLVFSRNGDSGHATPVEEYNCVLANLDYSNESPLTVPRGD